MPGYIGVYGGVEGIWNLLHCSGLRALGLGLGVAVRREGYRALAPSTLNLAGVLGEGFRRQEEGLGVLG